MAVRLLVGDCIDELKKLPSDSIDSIVTDPPYGLSFMGKKWDYDVPAKEMWAEALRVLKPGGHLISFGGSRTYHRMAVAIEDAGFEIRDQIMWIYGSGFPKSLNVSKAMDKAAGADREVVGQRKRNGGSAGFTADKGWNDGPMKDDDSTVQITAPATPEAQQWDGWGTALKPAHEPCVLARKPFPTSVAENVIEHGTGALNIDDCRIGAGEDRTSGGESGSAASSVLQDGFHQRRQERPTGGRWPANVILDEEAATVLDEQTGDLSPGNRPAVRNTNSVFTAHAQGETGHSEKLEGGGASRFFYCAKASKAERDAGLEEEKGNQGPKGNGLRRVCEFCGVWIMNPEECKCEVKSWVNPPQKNFHPTVKPVDLMRYLCRLVTPPGGVVLDPFMGSGTTGIAAIQEGFDFVGIEREADYAEIAAARIAHWGNADLTELEDGSVELELPPEAEWL
jgi:DNA modification methylase